MGATEIGPAAAAPGPGLRASEVEEEVGPPKEIGDDVLWSVASLSDEDVPTEETPPNPPPSENDIAPEDGTEMALGCTDPADKEALAIVSDGREDCEGSDNCNEDDKLGWTEATNPS